MRAPNSSSCTLNAIHWVGIGRKRTAPILALALFLIGNCAPAQWTTTIVETGVEASYISLTTVNGHPAITYYAESVGLKYIRAANASGSAWGTSILLDAGPTGLGPFAGYFNSLAIVNGNPAVAYSYEGNFPLQSLRFIRATDTSGSAWSAPIAIDTPGYSLRQDVSLAIVNGNPAVSYYGDPVLKYVCATNASGTAWGAPIIVDTSWYAGLGNSLVVVNGNPAISYFDNANFDIKFVRATNASGTAWGTPIAIDSVAVVSSGSSLAVVNGNPAISYHDYTNDDMKYVRANNPSGTTWGAPVAIDTAGVVGVPTDLAVVNGKPAISYLDFTNYDLEYVQATDASGTSWSVPVTIDGTGNVVFWSTLAVVNGNPAISYFDVSSYAIKYATFIPTPPPNAVQDWIVYE